MPLEVHSAAEVLKITSENKAFRSWPNRGEKNRVEPVARPDFRILFSVSPVPLTSTFRRLDVMVANAYSKSVLRAAAEAFCSRYDNVDYFPSYESVLLSSRRLAWNDDLVHPTDDIVKSNVYRMIQGYCGMELPMESPEEYASRVEARSTRLLREAIEDARKGREVIRRLERLEGLYASQQMLLEAKEAQLKQSQDTTARYLRQILERDGLLEPSSETKGGQA